MSCDLIDLFMLAAASAYQAEVIPDWTSRAEPIPWNTSSPGGTYMQTFDAAWHARGSDWKKSASAVTAFGDRLDIGWANTANDGVSRMTYLDLNTGELVIDRQFALEDGPEDASKNGLGSASIGRFDIVDGQICAMQRDDAPTALGGGATFYRDRRHFVGLEADGVWHACDLLGDKGGKTWLGVAGTDGRAFVGGNGYNTGDPRNVTLPYFAIAGEVIADDTTECAYAGVTPDTPSRLTGVGRAGLRDNEVSARRMQLAFGDRLLSRAELDTNDQTSPIPQFSIVNRGLFATKDPSDPAETIRVDLPRNSFPWAVTTTDAVYALSDDTVNDLVYVSRSSDGVAFETLGSPALGDLGASFINTESFDVSHGRRSSVASSGGRDRLHQTDLYPGVDAPPQLTRIEDQNVDRSVRTVVSDRELAAADLELSVAAADPDILANLVVTTDGRYRTVTWDTIGPGAAELTLRLPDRVTKVDQRFRVRSSFAVPKPAGQRRTSPGSGPRLASR